MMVVVFDLDDTLYKEIDYLRSAYRYIAAQLAGDDAEREEIFGALCGAYKEGRDAFATLMECYNNKGVTKETLLHWYRTHKPQISLTDGCEGFLSVLVAKGCRLGIITDGRSKTQRNKIKALSLDKYIAPYNIVISEEIGFEKTSFEPFRHFVNRYPNASEFIYIGDNPAKDFYNPNLMGWKTIMLIDKGTNIHSQTEESSKIHSPQIKINEITELLEII